MIKHKTKKVTIYSNNQTVHIVDSVDSTITEMLKEINDNGHTFLDLSTTAMIPSRYDEFSATIIITVVYREVYTRKILFEKTKE